MNNLMGDLEISKFFDLNNLVVTTDDQIEKNISKSIKSLIEKTYSQNLKVTCSRFEALTSQESRLVLEGAEKIYSLFEADDYEVIGIITKDAIAQFLQLLLGVSNKKSTEDLRHPSELELFFIDDLFSEISHLSICDLEDYIFKVNLKSDISLSCSFYMFRLPKVKGNLS